MIPAHEIAQELWWFVFISLGIVAVVIWRDK
jgi:hypothetical protein